MLLRLHRLGLNFTMKSCAESLALMSAIMHGPYLKRTQLLWLIWRYCLWAVCPCLSWSAVTFSRSIGVELDSERFHKSLALVKIWNVRIHLFNFKFSVYGHTQASIYTHASCNIVMLVWGLLGLAPTTKPRLQVWLWTTVQPPHHHHHDLHHHHPSHYGGLILDPSPPAQPVSEQAIKKRKKNLNGLVRSSIMLPNN